MWTTSLTIAVLSIYIATLHEGCAGGDAGELMAMACSGGIPHPPGYPLLMIVGRIWLLISPKLYRCPAWHLSLLSAIFGSISCGLIAQATTLCCGCIFSGMLAGGMWAFSHLTWKYSTHFEVFSLNNLLCSLIVYLTVVFTWNFITVIEEYILSN